MQWSILVMTIIDNDQGNEVKWTIVPLVIANIAARQTKPIAQSLFKKAIILMRRLTFRMLNLIVMMNTVLYPVCNVTRIFLNLIETINHFNCIIWLQYTTSLLILMEYGCIAGVKMMNSTLHWYLGDHYFLPRNRLFSFLISFSLIKFL